MGVIRPLVILLTIFLTGCTTSRWIANPEPTQDLSNSVILDSEPQLLISKYPTPNEPTLGLTLVERRLLEVPMVYKSTRVIQKYKPKYGFLAAGVIVAAGTVYLAENLDSQTQQSQKNLLRLTAGGFLLGSFLNMNPVGEPLETGETQQFGKASVTQLVDSTTVYTEQLKVIFNAALNGEALVTGREFLVNQHYTIDLVDELNLSDTQLTTDSSIEIQLVTENEVVDLQIDISSIMNQYIRISNQNTAVRSNTELTETNIITYVAPNSFLPLIDSGDELWYRTTLGASSAFVSKSDGHLVWRVGAGYNSDLIISTSGSQRGSVDIERDIPIIEHRNPDAVAIVVTQDSYSDEIKSVKNTHRSGDLVSEYFTKTLGIYEQNVIRLKSSYFTESINDILLESNQDGSFDFDNKDLFFYYSGAGEVTTDSTGVNFKLLSSDGINGIDLRNFLERVTKLNTRSNILILETDFSNGSRVLSSSNYSDSLKFMVDRFISSNPNSVIFIASEANQLASNYQSSDLRTDRIHGIFTYYFLQSLQSGNRTLPQIRDNLLRNVTFTSRRLHNRAQDPIIRFNSNFSLVKQE